MSEQAMVSMSKHAIAILTEQLWRQTFSSDQFTAIAHFIEGLDIETLTSALAKETESNTTLLSILNTLVSVVRVIYP